MGYTFNDVPFDEEQDFIDEINELIGEKDLVSRLLDIEEGDIKYSILKKVNFIISEVPKDYPELIEDDIDIYLCNFVYLIISKKEKEYIKEVSAYKKHDDHWDSYPVLKINLGTKDNPNEKIILYDRKNGFRNMTLEDMKKEGYEIENKKFIVEKKILEKYGLSIEDAKIEAKYERLELELR